jgi:ribosomal protein S18 acetylase RimI-like enzyme
VSTEIIYPNEKYFKSFHEALSTVAKERVYIEMIEAPPLEKVSSFQTDLISKNGPVYYAINNDRVVGWCDVFPEENPRQKHRGGLGMGLLPEFRGQGLGSKLLSSVLDHAKKFGLEKVELNVYTSNTPAVALYKKFGFEQEGLIKKYRKLDGQYFDCLAMGTFL